jgi:hypothetical protein
VRSKCPWKGEPTGSSPMPWTWSSTDYGHWWHMARARVAPLTSRLTRPLYLVHHFACMLARRVDDEGEEGTATPARAPPPPSAYLAYNQIASFLCGPRIWRLCEPGDSSGGPPQPRATQGWRWDLRDICLWMSENLLKILLINHSTFLCWFTIHLI